MPRLRYSRLEVPRKAGGDDADAIIGLLSLHDPLGFETAGRDLVAFFREAASARSLVENAAGIYPPDVRQEFRMVMRENRPRTFAALRDLRRARSNLAATIAASPFDEVAVQAAMKDVRDATGNLQAIIQDYLLTALKRSKSKSAS